MLTGGENTVMQQNKPIVMMIDFLIPIRLNSYHRHWRQTSTIQSKLDFRLEQQQQQQNKFLITEKTLNPIENRM
jgi:hypothetical protein